MTEPVRVSAVKVTAAGIRVDRGFEIRDPAVRTAATAAVGRGQLVDDWLTALVLAEVAEYPTPHCSGGEGDGLGAPAD